MVSLFNAVRDLDRLRRIYVVLVRHGFADLAQRLGFGAKEQREQLLLPEGETTHGEEERKKIALPERVRLVAIDLGPSFVKLGQIASTRPDVLPAAWITELKQLQDQVPPLPFATIKEAVESSLGASLEEIYDSFDEKPLAAASIGQVHRAVLKHESGPKEVVVKVQRPGVRATVARDLDLLHALAAVVERTIPEAKIYSPAALVDQFDRAITAELDFSLEAEHAARFTRNFDGIGKARFPIVYKEASSKQVLTLEFLAGSKVFDAIESRGFDGSAIAKTAVEVLVKMIFEDGFFHADPHPGNILILGEPSAPVLGMIDLGMVGRLSPEMRDKTIDLMIAAVQRDSSGLADALYAIGTPTRKVDVRAYRAEVAQLSEKYLGKPLKEIDLAAMIGDLVRGATKYGIEIPADFLLIGKALMTIEGVGKEIDPDLDVFETAKPLFFDLLKQRYSPQRIGGAVFRGLSQISGAAYDLPQQTREILEDLRLGRLAIRSTDPALPASYDRLGRRVFSGVVVAAFVIAGAQMLTSSAAPWIGATLLAFGVLLMLGHVARDVIRK